MVYYRRSLPHWQPEGTALFVTWRLHGSLPATARNWRPRTTKSSDILSRFPLDCARDKPNESFFAYDNRLDHAKLGPVWLQDPRVANAVEKGPPIGGKQAPALPTVRLCGDAQPSAYIVEALRYPWNRTQGF